MNRPNGYDDVQTGEFTPVRDGGHTCVIKQVSETTSKTGKPMVVVLLDFDKADDQKDYFADSFAKDIRPDKKWPANGSKWITSEDESGKCTKSFKSFITAFEDSNNTKVAWDTADWAKQFKGKKIGAVYGIEEGEYNGEVKKYHKLRWFCNYAKAKDQDAPAPKLLSASNSSAAPQSANSGDGFMNIPTGIEDELPF